MLVDGNIGGDLAGIDAQVTRVAAEIEDGLLAHSFTTARYLSEVTLLAVAEHRPAGAPFTICYHGLVATGADKESHETAVAAVRKQIAFYGATPAYRPVLEHHGWAELHTELQRLSRRGDWDTMTALVDHAVLAAFAVTGEPAAAGAEIARRFGDVVERFTLATPYPLDEGTHRRIVAAVRTAGED